MSGSPYSNKIFPTNDTIQILLDQFGFCQQGIEVVRQIFCDLDSKACTNGSWVIPFNFDFEQVAEQGSCHGINHCSVRLLCPKSKCLF